MAGLGSLAHGGWLPGGHSVVMLGRQSFLCASPASPLMRVRRSGSYSQWQRRSTAIASVMGGHGSLAHRLAGPVARSAVVPAALPAQGRFAPVAGQPAPLLIGVRRPGWSVSWQGGVPPCQSHWQRLAVASCWLTPTRPPCIICSVGKIT